MYVDSHKGLWWSPNNGGASLSWVRMMERDGFFGASTTTESLPGFIHCPSIPFKQGSTVLYQVYSSIYNNGCNMTPGSAGNYDYPNPGRYLDSPALLVGYKAASRSAANYIGPVAPSKILWLADGIDKDDVPRQQMSASGDGTTNGIAVPFMVHTGRANLLTINGSVTSVANEEIYDYFNPATAGVGDYYSIRVRCFRVPGGDGAISTPVVTTW